MKAIDFGLPDLSKLDGAQVAELARKIRTFTGCAEKAVLASELFNEADDMPTEMLREIAITYAEALRGCPGMSDNAYREAAQLIRDTHTTLSFDDPTLSEALARVDAETREIETTGFTLTDLRGKTWTLAQLRGKVVLVNFWFAGCPPCVHELPALEALYRQFRNKGLVILAVDDANKATDVRQFAPKQHLTYPVLPDPESVVTKRFQVSAYPTSMVFDSAGKLAARVTASRTVEQFTEILQTAGLQ